MISDFTSLRIQSPNEATRPGNAALPSASFRHNLVLQIRRFPPAVVMSLLSFPRLSRPFKGVLALPSYVQSRYQAFSPLFRSIARRSRDRRAAVVRRRLPKWAAPAKGYGHGSNEREVHLKSLLTSTSSDHQHQSAALFPHIPVIGENCVPLLSLQQDRCRWLAQVDERSWRSSILCGPSSMAKRYCTRHIARQAWRCKDQRKRYCKRLAIAFNHFLVKIV